MKPSEKMKRLPTHPGELLAKDVFPAAGLDAKSAAVKFDVTESYMSAVLREEARLTAELCVQLGNEFGNSPQFWVNMQKNHDAAMASRRSRKKPFQPK